MFLNDGYKFLKKKLHNGGHKVKRVVHNPEECKALHPELAEDGTQMQQGTAAGTATCASRGVGFQDLMYASNDEQE